MKSLFIFITSYVCLCVCSSNVHGLQCNGKNEEIKCYQHCPPESTCLNRDSHFNCFVSNEKCQFKCICKNGYYRDITGECVTYETCENKCPGLNEYYDCGGACDNVCETLHIMNQTHCPIVNIKCNEMCYCKDGYARDENNICVPYEKCQPSKERHDRKRRDTSSTSKVTSCGLDEEYKTCTCPPDTCMSLVAKFRCGPCESGCACRAGYLRLTADAPCRPMRECPQLAHSPDFN